MANEYSQPIFKSYERMTQQPLEKNSLFDTKADAELYARRGATGMSSAFPGQVISVKDNNGKTAVFVINNTYTLASISSSSTVADDSSYATFDYTYESGYALVIIPESSYLKTISITITEDFDLDGAFSIKDSDGKVYFGYEDMNTDEAGDYSKNINEYIETSKRLLLVFNETKPTRGEAILKIN